MVKIIRNNPNIIENGFSDRTLKLLKKCTSELLDSGVFLDKRLCYFKYQNNKYHLYFSIKDLGSLGILDINFKRLIHSIKKDVGNFYCILLPCSLYGNNLTVIKNSNCFNDIYENIISKVIIKSYNSKGEVIPLYELAFNLVGSEESKFFKIRKLLTNSNGKAKVMASRLNLSGFSYVGWVVAFDDLHSQKIMYKDSLGNVQYIELIL